MTEIRARDLTPSQCAILNEAARGHENKIIAHELGIGFETVKEQLARAYRKLNALNREEAVKRHHRQKTWKGHVCGAQPGRDNGELELSPEEVAGGGQHG